VGDIFINNLNKKALLYIKRSMADQYTYPKKRKEFGRHAQFEDSDIKIVGAYAPNHNHRDLYQLRDPNKLILDNIP
jgi:hypothetical protein